MPSLRTPVRPGSRVLRLLLACGVLLVGSCASLQQHEPIDVTLAGVESLPGQGMEMRMLVKLRVQNPNDQPLPYSGVSVRMNVRGKRFASGVSDNAGTVPRFGEAVVAVPVSISVLRLARAAVGITNGEYHGKLDYELSGRLASSGTGGARFISKGEFSLPAEITRPVD